MLAWDRSSTIWYKWAYLLPVPAGGEEAPMTPYSSFLLHHRNPWLNPWQILISNWIEGWMHACVHREREEYMNPWMTRFTGRHGLFTSSSDSEILTRSQFASPYRSWSFVPRHYSCLPDVIVNIERKLFLLQAGYKWNCARTKWSYRHLTEQLSSAKHTVGSWTPRECTQIVWGHRG